MDAILRQRLQCELTEHGHHPSSALWLESFHAQFDGKTTLNPFDIADAIHKQPALTQQSPLAVATAISSTAPLLGVTDTTYASMFLKHPDLALADPEHIAENATLCAAAIDVQRAIFIKATSQNPELLLASAQSLAHVTTECAQEIDISPQTFAIAACKHTPLFNQTAKNIRRHVTDAAEALKIPSRGYIYAAMNYPSFFSRSPHTLAEKVPYIRRIAEALNTSSSTLTLLQTHPDAFTYSNKHLHLRLIVAKAGLAGTALRTALRMPQARAERLTRSHYATSSRALYVMEQARLLR